jgi:MoxR-like ATPase
MNESYLCGIGVYGFEPVELVILASLVTEDPLLLIGPCGTGKTYLLNSLSEALGLEHRHYNASLVAFDDLVGFPYPDDGRTAIRYLQTPATVWGAQSVLIDEINRCRPEHQNRLFSLVHERRIQGLLLESLRYRWAAMNPATLGQGPGESYAGAEPLDVALADRFAFVVEVADWADLSDEDRERITDPRGDGVISDDGGALRRALEGWKERYAQLLAGPPRPVTGYAHRVVTLLNQAGIRVSPRRARQLARNLLGVSAVRGAALTDRDALLALHWSLPHRAWGEAPADEAVRGAHRAAWEACFSSDEERWIHDFLADPTLHGRADRLFDPPDPDTASIAVARALVEGGPERQAAFAFAVYPAALEGHVPVGREGLADLGRVAKDVLTVNGEIRWQERLSESDTKHPEATRLSQVLHKLRGGRRERATQLFHWCLVNKVTLSHPVALEEEFNEAVKAVRRHVRREAA